MGVIINFNEMTSKGLGYFCIRQWDRMNLAAMYQYQGQKYPITGYLIYRNPDVSFCVKDNEEFLFLHFEVVVYYPENIYRYRCTIDDKNKIDVYHGDISFIGKKELTDDVFANPIPMKALKEHQKVLEELLLPVTFDKILYNILKGTSTFKIGINTHTMYIYQTSYELKNSDSRYTICNFYNKGNHIETISFGMKYNKEKEAFDLFEFSPHKNMMFFMGLKEEYLEAKEEILQVLPHINQKLLFRFINVFREKQIDK